MRKTGVPAPKSRRKSQPEGTLPPAMSTYEVAADTRHAAAKMTVMSEPTTSRKILAGLCTAVVLCGAIFLFIPSLRMIGAVLLASYFVVIMACFRHSILVDAARKDPDARWWWLAEGVLGRSYWKSFVKRQKMKDEIAAARDRHVEA
jgi:hypothetical protein